MATSDTTNSKHRPYRWERGIQQPVRYYWDVANRRFRQSPQHSKPKYDKARHVVDTFSSRARSRTDALHVESVLQAHGNDSADALRLQVERLRPEFNALAERWRRDTQHVSLISKKVAHPSYFRIMGMGRAVVPLLLETLRDNPDHWFAALKATSNIDPVPAGSNPSAAREAWLTWGRSEGLIR
jgi:hypothetical protein